MTINPHITRALGRERTADLLREAAANRAAAEAAQPTQPEPRREPAQRQPLDLIPAGAQKR
jgi:hypothetical protein